MTDSEQKTDAGSTIGGPATLSSGPQWRRLWLLLLLLVVAVSAAQRFVGIAQDPAFQIHSDDLLWMDRFRELPRTAQPGEEPHYGHGIDTPALERYVFHYLLLWTGRMPGQLPRWDYDQSFEWNVAQGNVAPAEAVRLVRVVNAVFMIAATVIVYVAFAGTVGGLAGLVAALYLVLSSGVVDVLWSIGPDPLLWMLLSVALLLWARLPATWWAAVVVGAVGGLATSAKLNGSIAVAGYCLWLLIKRRPLWALYAAAAAFVVFAATNPFVFSNGVLRMPQLAGQMFTYRAHKGMLFAQDYDQHHGTHYADAPRWMVFFWLMGKLWVLLPLTLVSRRFLLLRPLAFGCTALAVGHALAVTTPVGRYTLPIDAGLAWAAIAAYWPRPLRLPTLELLKRWWARRREGG